MKKLSLMIAIGCLCLLSIAKPMDNVNQFETYTQQMKTLSENYLQKKQFSNANKTIDAWLNSYRTLTKEQQQNIAKQYAAILYNKACALTQIDEKYQALKMLKEAVNAGFNDKTKAENEPNLTNLKQYDTFAKILNEIK